MLRAACFVMLCVAPASGLNAQLAKNEKCSATGLVMKQNADGQTWSPTTKTCRQAAQEARAAANANAPSQANRMRWCPSQVYDAANEYWRTIMSRCR